MKKSAITLPKSSEIMVRIWEEKTKMFHYTTVLDLLKSRVSKIKNPFIQLGAHLKDVEGTWLYEGDLIVDEELNFYRIFYQNGSFKYGSNNVSKNMEPLYAQDIFNKKLRVVGNIVQNSDLFTEYVELVNLVNKVEMNQRITKENSNKFRKKLTNGK